MVKLYYAVQGGAAALLAWVSAKLGILFPVLGMLLVLMVIDYFTGMLASKRESLDHPGDISYGWSSKKGAVGIIKKVAYVCIIVVGMVLDYVILNVSAQLGIESPTNVFFGLLVAVWYILNELLSVIENAGRMGANVPEWLCKYIAVLKNKIDKTEGE